MLADEFLNNIFLKVLLRLGALLSCQSKNSMDSCFYFSSETLPLRTEEAILLPGQSLSIWSRHVGWNEVVIKEKSSQIRQGKETEQSKMLERKMFQRTGPAAAAFCARAPVLPLRTDEWTNKLLELSAFELFLFLKQRDELVEIKLYGGWITNWQFDF